MRSKGKKLITALIILAFIIESTSPGYALRPMSKANFDTISKLDALRIEKILSAIDSLRDEEFMVEGISLKQIAKRLRVKEKDLPALEQQLHWLVKHGYLSSFVTSVELDEEGNAESIEIRRQTIEGKIDSITYMRKEKDLCRRYGGERFLLGMGELEKRRFPEKEAKAIVSDEAKLRQFAVALTQLFGDRLNPTLYATINILNSWLKDYFDYEIEGMVKDIAERCHSIRRDNALYRKVADAWKAGEVDKLDIKTVRQFIVGMYEQMGKILRGIEKLRKYKFSVSDKGIDSETVRYLDLYYEQLETSHVHFAFVFDVYTKLAQAIEEQQERPEIAVRSIRHGDREYLNILKDLDHSFLTLNYIIPEEKCLMAQKLGPLFDQVNPIIRKLVNLTELEIKDYEEAIEEFTAIKKEMKALRTDLYSMRDTIISEFDKLKDMEKDEKDQHIAQIFTGIQKAIDKLQDRIDLAHGKPGKREKICNIGKLLREDNVYVGNFLGKVEDVYVKNVNTLRLLEALENLIKNAEIHGKAKNVEVSVQEKHGYCEIRVEDDGRGTKPSLLKEGKIPGKQRLFELGTTTKRGKKGGPGLAIVWHFVKDQDGTIEVKSKRRKGTTFIIRLPATRPPKLLPKWKFEIKNLELGTTKVDEPFGKRKITITSVAAGSGLERMYKLLSGGEEITAKEIIGFVKSAEEKPDARRRTKKERLSVKVVSTSIDVLASELVKTVEKLKIKQIKIVLFGGVAEGAGEFYRNRLQQKVNELSGSKNIEIVLSKMGRRRAIIGAVAYALSKGLISAGKGAVIGTDLGGTSNASAVVVPETLQIKGEIVTYPTFPDKVSSRLMDILGEKIEDATVHMDISNLPKELEAFLPNGEDREAHEQLTRDVLEQLDQAIQAVEQKNDIKAKAECLASAGIFSDKGSVELAYALPFTTVDVRKELGEKTGKKIYMGNDVACAGVGEMIDGAGKEEERILILDVGTGLNMALVSKIPTSIEMAKAHAHGMGIDWIGKIRREFPNCEGLEYLKNKEVIEKGWRPELVYKLLEAFEKEKAILDSACKKFFDKKGIDYPDDYLSFDEIILSIHKKLRNMAYFPDSNSLLICLLSDLEVQEFIEDAGEDSFHEFIHKLTFESETFPEIEMGERIGFKPKKVIFDCKPLYFFDISAFYKEQFPGVRMLRDARKLYGAEFSTFDEFNGTLYFSEIELVASKLKEELRPGSVSKELSILVKRLKPFEETKDLVWAALRETFALKVGRKDIVAEHRKKLEDFLSSLQDKKAEVVRTIYKFMKEKFSEQYETIRIDEAFKQAYEEARAEILGIQPEQADVEKHHKISILIDAAA